MSVTIDSASRSGFADLLRGFEMQGQRPAPASDIVDSWKGIAAYLGRDLRTVIRWEQTRGLPVHRLPGGPKAAVYALRSELEKWRKGRGIHVLDEADEPAPALPGPSIAVLPFANLSPDKENEYFSDGLADEIITALARREELRVVARTSSFAFRGREQDVRAIGASLGVETLLEGSVQRVGSWIRVSAQLVNCTDGCHVWCDRYDRELTDILAVQDEIARAIAAALRLKVGPPPAAARKLPNLQAYQLWLKGRHYQCAGRSAEDLLTAGKCYAQAVALDPGFAAAHLAVGRHLLDLAIVGFIPPRQVAEQGRAEIQKALALDGRLGEAHAAEGLFRALFDFDWEGSEEAFHRALQCDPGSPVILRMHATMLPALRRLPQAETEARRALELDPLSAEAHFILAMVLFLGRQYEQAESSIRTAVELGSANPSTLWVAGMVAAMQGRFAAALASCEEAVRRFGNAPLVAAGLGMLCAWAGRKAEARRVLEQLERTARTGYVSPICQAIVYTGLGETDQAFAWLERAVECRDPHILHLPAKPVWDSLRADPRFALLLRKMRLDAGR